MRPLALRNRQQIEALVGAAGGSFTELPLPAYQDARALGRLISRNFQELGLLDLYEEVVLDVSAMPRSVFFPLARGILERAHSPATSPQHWAGNFHLTVCENPAADEVILEGGTQPMAPIGGFGPSSGTTARTTIWVPVLGENSLARVERLYEDLVPNETCPVIPWPSEDPRRGDRLVLEYRRQLFEQMRIEPRNIIYAAERNPFDLYRSIGALHERYRDALSPLGEVSMVVSSHSSKLLSVGVLLAAYENQLVVQHVSPGSYGLRDGADDLRDQDEVFDVWLTGLPYR